MVNRKGMNFEVCFAPTLGIAISSLIKTIIGSINLPIPFGNLFSDFLYDLAALTKININRARDKNIENTFFVTNPGIMVALL